MPDGLSLRTTALLVALAFGLTFAGQALLGGGSSAAKPPAKRIAAASVADAQGAAPNLRLVAAASVPALREPRQPRKRKVHELKPAVRDQVSAAPEFTPTPVTPAASVSPTPTAAPRYIPPAPPHVTPAPKPTARPTPSSGEFDTSGEP
jgi:hypothetical protein